MEKTLFRPEYRILLGLVRQARIDAGLTQEELAIRLVVPRSTVTKWETGQQRMDILEFWEVCLGVNADPLEILATFRGSLNPAKKRSKQPQR